MFNSDSRSLFEATESCLKGTDWHPVEPVFCVTHFRRSCLGGLNEMLSALLSAQLPVWASSASTRTFCTFSLKSATFIQTFPSSAAKKNMLGCCDKKSSRKLLLMPLRERRITYGKVKDLCTSEAKIRTLASLDTENTHSWVSGK